MKKSKSFFDLPIKEKEQIIKKAAFESNRAQKELIEKITNPMKSPALEKGLVAFDKKFIAKNDCSNDPIIHSEYCQGCIKIIIEEPEEIKSFIRSLAEAVRRETIEQIEREVIGEDEKVIWFNDKGIKHTSTEALQNNELREKQRAKLQNMKV